MSRDQRRALRSQIAETAVGVALFLGVLLLVLGLACLGALNGLWEISATVVVFAATVAAFAWSLTPRRWVTHRYTRRLGCALLAVAAIVFSVHAAHVVRLKSAVASVTSRGGRVHYDYRWQGSGFVKTKRGWIVPSGIRDTLGDAWLADVDDVNFGYGRVTDQDISVMDLSPFSSVSFFSSPITDASLISIAKNRKLRRLTLSQTRVTDAGMTHLESLSKLEQLWLNDTFVSEASISSLAKMKSLRFLAVPSATFSAEGIQKLRKALPGCDVVSWKST